MKKLLLPILVAIAFSACKDDETVAPKAKVYYTDNVVFSSTAGSCTKGADGSLFFSGVSGGAIAVTKLTNTGNLLWAKQYSIPTGLFSSNTAIAEDADQNLYVAASGQFGLFVLKINQDGVLQWNNSYGGMSGDDVNCIIPTSDGNLLVSGSEFSSNFFLYKIATDGTQLWQNSYVVSSQQTASHLLETPEGDYILTGANTGFGELVYLKVNTNGDVVWDKTNTVSGLQFVGNTTLLPDGSLATCGSVMDNTGNFQSFVFKADANGNGQWQRSYGSVPNTEVTRYIIQGPNGGFLLTGQSSSQTSGRMDGHLLSVSASGDSLGFKYFAASQNISPMVVFKQPTGNNLIVGFSDNGNGTSGTFMSYIDANGNFK